MRTATTKRISYRDKVEPPANCVSNVCYREEESCPENSKFDSNIREYEETILTPLGRMISEVPKLKTRNVLLNIGTWNVRTLYELGKLDNLIQEIKSMRLDVMGICETRWTGTGMIYKNEYTMMYSGVETHVNGVAIIMKNSIARSIKGFTAVNDRIIAVKIAAQPLDILLIQVYAPTAGHEEEDVEIFYENLKESVEMAKSNDIIIVMGDFNAKVGNEKISECMGQYGLGKRNKRGDRLIQFCEENKLIITNTLFKHPARRVYTWKSPGDICRNQIDFILIKERFRIIKQAKSYLGADINSDHNPVVVKAKIKLKTCKQKSVSKS
ncbi:craniofacial development protein 2-like [Centruroides sculpturatus]|uniref:craniofacial development protein 2-like n=1 Tax=Centruroides sculpturatus TaxID=218467 RepID=UPI000C6EE4B1|nr:craniofacial development protein 2-like [Centruroides sculpturatus]